MTWWERLLGRPRLDAELDAELQDHVERSAAAHRALGLGDQEARRLALSELGGLDPIRERCRDTRGTRWLEDLVNDTRFAARGLVSRWPFALLVITILSIGLGVTTMFFTMYYTLTMRGLPIPAPDRVAWIEGRDTRARPLGVSYLDFEDMRRSASSFEGMAALVTGPVAIADDDQAPDRFTHTFISADGFRLLGEVPVLGRDLLPADDRPGASPVVVLGGAVWERRYGRDPDIIGRTVRINGTSAEVVGVMRPGFRFPARTDLWRPLGQLRDLDEQPRDDRRLGVFGRLEDGRTLGEAETEIAAIAARLSDDFPDTNAGFLPVVTPINDRYTQDPTQGVWIAFMTAGVVILLVACANVANLLLMRAAERSHEIALRASLGATRLRIIRQALTESAVLAAIGGLGGLGCAWLGLRILDTFIPDDTLGYAHTMTFDARVFAVLALVSLGTVLVFGLVPSVFVAKTRAVDFLTDTGRTGTMARAARWTSVFLTVEFGLTLILLTALGDGVRAGLTGQSPFTEIVPDDLLTAQITLPDERYDTPDRRVAFYAAFQSALDELPVVTSGTIMSALPTNRVGRRQVELEGAPSESDDIVPEVGVLTIDEAYFETLDIALHRGRPFHAADGTPGFGNAIVNQRVVDVLFPGTDPLGRRFRLRSETPTGAPTPWLTIVGVAPVIRQQPNQLAGRRAADPLVYLPLRLEAPTSVAVVVRGSDDPGATTSAVRRAAQGVDPNLPLFRPLSLARAIAESEWNGRLSNLILMTIAGLALALSAIGLYGVTAHAVGRRTREIGVRMALGAATRDVWPIVVRGVVARLAIGSSAGVLCIYAWSRWVGGDAASAPRLWLMLVPSVAVLTLVGLAAVIPIVRRTITLDPVRVLRWE